ncbi:MAG: HAD-IIIA family hydrolase [Clostridia bacterium]|nr:HAD-IIIA family hydrolase [Clostridia bacterium]
MKAVILAGGKGTRLGSLTEEIPKPLINICGKPVLEYQVENYKRAGITEIILVIGHLGHKIKEYFGDGKGFGVNITYYEEQQPLGTAGALYYLKDVLTDDFVLSYGDVIFDIDFERFISFHRKMGCLASLAVHPNDHPYDSDVIKMTAAGMVEGIIGKSEKRDFYYNNCINAGVFVFSRGILDYVQENMAQDLEKNIIARAIEGRICGYKTSEYIKDMGTPERYKLVQEHVKKGVAAKRNLAGKQKAVFLDRDGTINKYVGLLSEPEQLKIYDDVYPALNMLNSSEYLSIVVTNQPVVARNMCTVEGLENIHKKLETNLGEHRVYVDDILYCPHHPDKGYPGENKDYKIVCTCRKPAIGMIEKAALRYNIDLSESYLIGDTTVDIKTGKNAGLKTILLSRGEGGKDKKFDVVPEAYAENLLEAVKKIINT